SVGESTVRTWFLKLRCGEFDFDDKEGLQRRSELYDYELKALVGANTRSFVRRFAEQLGVCIGTMFTHSHHITKMKKLDKWVPHELNDNQKNRPFEVSSALIRRIKNGPFLDRIVTCDEKWILYDNRQPEIAPKKVMVTVWWSGAEQIHRRFLNLGEMNTAEKHPPQLDEMHSKLQQQQAALVD
ncbi:hypothetical protein Angca_002838, partial [Angiostrongylus cantonensis]